MGGKDFRRGRGWIRSLGRVSSDSTSEAAGETTSTGTFLLAAVEGLMSWCGEGWRLMEADWIAEASSAAGFDAMTQIGA